MLDGFVKKSPVKLKDLAEYMNIAAPSLCKIMKAKFYMSNDDYDKVYDYISSHNGIVPRQDNVSAYPSDKSKGSWDIWIDNQFVVTMIFSNDDDLLSFLNGNDGRLWFIKEHFMNKDNITYDNRIALRGHTKK